MQESCSASPEVSSSSVASSRSVPVSSVSTSPSQTALAAATPTVSPDPPEGLEQGAKIGIGVGLGIGLSLATALLFLIIYYRRRAKTAEETARRQELEDTSPRKGEPGTWYRAELAADNEKQPFWHELDGDTALRREHELPTNGPDRGSALRREHELPANGPDGDAPASTDPPIVPLNGADGDRGLHSVDIVTPNHQTIDIPAMHSPRT
ncbi:MAG: hypothetical protein Q9217_006596 [Psora testacea]